MTLNSEGLTKVIPALIEAQKSFKPAVKDSVNPAFKTKYAGLDAVLEAVSGSLLKNGLALVQQTDIDDAGTTVLLTRLIHTSGEWIGCRYPVKPVKQDPQGEGSALTYSRRYALMALVGIAPEDDDGAAASRPAERRSAPPREQPPSPAELRGQIAELGLKAGMTVDEIKDDFAAFSEGSVITSASVEMLAKYRDSLRKVAP